MRILYKQTAMLLTAGILFTGCAGKGAVQEERKKQEDTVLTILVQRSGTNMTGTWEGEGAERLYEETGIRLEFYSNGKGDDQRLKQYLAAGTLPDIIGFRDMEQAELLLGAEVLENLDDYKDVFADLTGTEPYETALRYYRENYGGTEEHLYFLPTSVGEQEDVGYWMPMVQWNIYEKAGEPKIDTLEDYLDAAELMMEKKATTALGEPIYGFSLCSDWSERKMQQPSSLYGFYGWDVGTVSPLFAVDALTETLSSILREGSFYKRALHFYFEANQRGVLDPESRTQTLDGLEKKYQTGQILFSGYEGQTENYGDTEDGKIDEYVPLPAKDMRLYRDADNPVGANWYFGVNKNSDNKEKACEFLNWFYDPENIAFLYQDRVETDSHSEEAPVFQWYGLTETEVGVTEKEHEKGTESAVRSIQGTPAVYMIDALPVELQAVEKQIQEMVQDLSWEMIYAENEEQFEQHWTEMLQNADSMGIKQLAAHYHREWKQALEMEKSYKIVEE